MTNPKYKFIREIGKQVDDFYVITLMNLKDTIPQLVIYDLVNKTGKDVDAEFRDSYSILLKQDQKVNYFALDPKIEE